MGDLHTSTFEAMSPSSGTPVDIHGGLADHGGGTLVAKGHFVRDVKVGQIRPIGARNPVISPKKEVYYLSHNQMMRIERILNSFETA